MTRDVAEVRLLDRPLINKAFILFAALMWGFSFTTMKGLVNEMPVFHLLAMRNALATVAMVVWVRGRLLRERDRRTLLLGLALGATGFGAYATQTVGLSMTTPGKNAFLTSC